MKTVIDAVNEFKGDLDNIPSCSRERVLILRCNVSDSSWKRNAWCADDENYTPSVFEQVCTVIEFNQCVDEMSKAEWIKPVTKPTYTQSMADNGVLPLVGMEVLYTCIEHQSGKPVIEVGKWYSGTIIAYHDGFVWTSDNGLRQLSNTKFKPVDTRTNSDKAFDKFLSDEYNSNIAEFQDSESDVDFIVGLQSAWKAAIKFQLLEVKS